MIPKALVCCFQYRRTASGMCGYVALLGKNQPKKSGSEEEESALLAT